MLWSAPSGQTNGHRILEHGANTDWVLEIGAGDTVVYYSPGTSTSDQSNSAICDGNWHVLHATYYSIPTADGYNVALYVDGVVQTGYAYTSSTTLTTQDNLYLFAYGGGGYISQSSAAGLFVWNRALTSAEISTHAATPWSIFLPQYPGAYLRLASSGNVPTYRNFTTLGALGN
jgi:hypothetical protein